jgi:hypothetical protein
MRRLIALLMMLAPLAAAAQAPVYDDIDLELVLLADATGSIDDQEIRFQRRGYAEAIVDPQVVKAITEGAHGKIAVAYVEWADQWSQDVVVDWMVIDGAQSAALFAERLMTPPRRAFGRNAIGAALMKGVDMIETNDHEGFRKVIDFSADSANNWNGPLIEEGRAAAQAAGITINGLAVLCRSCPTGRASNYDLEAAFASRIVTGPGHFVVTADGDAAFADAVRRKLILEISGRVPQTRFAASEGGPLTP